MPRRRSIRGVLGNFLGGLVSRYSEHNGYWIFGTILEALDAGVTVDLLGSEDGTSDASPLGSFFRMAHELFHEQLAKGRIPIAHIREARLVLTKSPINGTTFVAGHRALAHEITLTVNAITDLGAQLERSVSIRVAPHDPTAEMRSGRR